MSSSQLMPGETGNAADITSYEAAVRFLDSLDVSVMKLGLDRMRRILDTLHNPQDRLPMVHIAGTNGKGSVTAMLASVLKHAGYTVGSFTSPHLIHVRERIAVDGNPILPDEFQAETAGLKAHLEQELPREEWPTYFEFLNVMAYRYFLSRQVDIAIFETGLGGRLDSTNVVKHPNLTVITGIDLEHTHILGDTVEAIAREKAGILKPETPVVLGSQMAPEARRVIEDIARSQQARVVPANADALTVETHLDSPLPLAVVDQNTRYELPLAAPYQKYNVAVVLACVDQLRQQGFSISERAVKDGLAHTYWPARFQLIRSKRLFVDGSHNAQGFRTLAEALKAYAPDRQLHWLISLRGAKPVDGLVELLKQFPETRGIRVCQGEPAHLYHAPENLRDFLQPHFPHLPIDVASPEAGLQGIERDLQANETAFGVVTGSLYTAGQILRQL